MEVKPSKLKIDSESESGSQVLLCKDMEVAYLEANVEIMAVTSFP